MTVYTKLKVLENLLKCIGNIYFWKYSSNFECNYANCPHPVFWQKFFHSYNVNNEFSTHGFRGFYRPPVDYSAISKSFFTNL